LAVLDGDIIAFRAAFWADGEGVDALEDRLKLDVEAWTPNGCSKVILAFSDNRANNFRRDLWPDYKSHRDEGREPECLHYAHEILRANWGWRQVDRLEADDLMGILTSENKAVCVTIDKDLKQIPGWHYHPEQDDRNPRYNCRETADYWFHLQWMAGDSTDHYPGIPGIGPAKAEKLVLSQTAPAYWTLATMALFERRELSLEFCLAQRCCAKILRTGDWDATTRLPRPYVY
jgi:hypothetical protein